MRLVRVDTGTNQTLARGVNLLPSRSYSASALIAMWEGIVPADFAMCRGCMLPPRLARSGNGIGINSVPTLMGRLRQQTFLKARCWPGYVPSGAASGFPGGRWRLTARPSCNGPGADRQLGGRPSDHRHGADHGDVVRLRLAVQGRGRRGDVTFFPMLVNTVEGLRPRPTAHAADLMRTYAASYWQTLVKLRLPAPAPFIFNALEDLHSTLALIGAIVAEFFGTPIVGMGFRISTEVGRMALDMVWAEIVGGRRWPDRHFYGLVALHGTAPPPSGTHSHHRVPLNVRHNMNNRQGRAMKQILRKAC